VIVYTDYFGLKHLVFRKDAKHRLVRWILLYKSLIVRLEIRKVLKTLLLTICLGFSMMDKVSQVFLSASPMSNYMLSTLILGMLTL